MFQWLKYKLLQAMFTVLQKDASAMSRGEFVHLLAMKGANKMDAAVVFDAWRDHLCLY